MTKREERDIDQSNVLIVPPKFGGAMPDILAALAFRDPLRLSDHRDVQKKDPLGATRNEPVRKVTKRVRFAEHEDPGMESEGTFYKEDRHELWWTSRELKVLKAESRRLARAARSSSICDLLHRLYGACLNTSNSEAKQHETFFELSESEDRGLEPLYFPELIFHRRSVVQHVIKVQERVTFDMAPEQKCLVLAAACNVLTKQSRKVARIVGINDAATVHKDEPNVLYEC